MITLGFSCAFSGVLTLDVPINFTVPSISGSTYIIVDPTTAGGDIVYVNPQGYTQVWKGASPGLNPIGAKKILSSATINDIEYTTTATVIGWAADPTW